LTDDYRGFNIPEGSIVLANAWAIARDPANYDEPLKFMPERFLNTRELDPANYVFGFGRRCVSAFSPNT
jgi:cytochrome P450